MSDVCDRAKALLEGVSDGPWEHFYPNQCCSGHCVTNDHGGPVHSFGGDDAQTHVDAEFIAAARTLVPELVAAVERQRRALDALKKVIEHLPDDVEVPSAYVVSAQMALANLAVA